MAIPNDDERLKGRLAAGEAAAFADLYDRYGRILYGYLLTLTGRVADAEDLLQEVMLRLVRSRGRLRRVRNLRAYLYAVARNEWRRRRPGATATRPGVPIDPAAAAPAEVPHDVGAALRRLPPERSEVVLLKLRHDLTFAEIGEVLSVSPNTAASRYRYALRDLARILETSDVRR